MLVVRASFRCLSVNLTRRVYKPRFTPLVYFSKRDQLVKKEEIQRQEDPPVYDK